MTVLKTYFMLMAADMDRAVRFYKDAFGLTESFTSPEWSELQAGGATVALHGGGTGEHQQTGLGFDVDDIDAACEAIVAAGGTITAPPRERPGEGIKLADVVDTEGNGFSISQSSHSTS